MLHGLVHVHRGPSEPPWGPSELWPEGVARHPSRLMRMRGAAPAGRASAPRSGAWKQDGRRRCGFGAGFGAPRRAETKRNGYITTTLSPGGSQARKGVRSDVGTLHGKKDTGVQYEDFMVWTRGHAIHVTI